jgi:hypothetical protein
MFTPLKACIAAKAAQRVLLLKLWRVLSTPGHKGACRTQQTAQNSVVACLPAEVLLLLEADCTLQTLHWQQRQSLS